MTIIFFSAALLPHMFGETQGWQQLTLPDTNLFSSGTLDGQPHNPIFSVFFLMIFRFLFSFYVTSKNLVYSPRLQVDAHVVVIVLGKKVKTIHPQKFQCVDKLLSCGKYTMQAVYTYEILRKIANENNSDLNQRKQVELKAPIRPRSDVRLKLCTGVPYNVELCYFIFSMNILERSQIFSISTFNLCLFHKKEENKL